MAAEAEQTPDQLQRGLRILYWVGIGYPLACAALHLLWNLNDHSLILFLLPLLLPVAALILALSLTQTAWLSKLTQGLKHSVLVFLTSFGTTLILAFLDIFHCGFGD